MNRVGVLFVCMGNICRSPTAHGVFQALVDSKGFSTRFRISSAGTYAGHKGAKPDPRAIKAAAKRGIDLEYIRSRGITLKDFEDYHYIVVMDEDNLANVMKIKPNTYQGTVTRLLDITPAGGNVPDPYFGGTQGFERVLDLVIPACTTLLEQIVEKDLRRLPKGAS